MAVAQATVRRAGAASRRLEADICVVGSGAAGLSAALASARLGRRTILVDASPQLGGQAVTSALGTFCGFFSNGRAPVQVTRGVADEFFRDLAASGALAFMDGRRNTRIGLYDVLAWLAGLECRETGGVHGTMMMAIDGVDDAALAALDRRLLFARVVERGAAYGLVRRTRSIVGACQLTAAHAHALDLAGAGSVHQIDVAALRARIAANLG